MHTGRMVTMHDCRAFGLSNYKKKPANKGVLSHATKLSVIIGLCYVEFESLQVSTIRTDAFMHNFVVPPATQ